MFSRRAAQLQALKYSKLPLKQSNLVLVALFPPCPLSLALGLLGAAVMNQASSLLDTPKASSPTRGQLAVLGQVERARLGFFGCSAGSGHVWWSRAWLSLALLVLRMPGPSWLLDICKGSSPIPSPPWCRSARTEARVTCLPTCPDGGQRSDGLKVEGWYACWWQFLGEILPNNMLSCFPDRASIWTSSWSCTGLSARPFTPSPWCHRL